MLMFWVIEYATTTVAIVGMLAWDTMVCREMQGVHPNAPERATYENAEMRSKRHARATAH